jgi:hypothetical protein
VRLVVPGDGVKKTMAKIERSIYLLHRLQ